MTIYFLAAMPRTKLFFYRLIPHSRRPRVILIGDEIFTKVGGYVLGNVITSFIAGLGTFFWMLAFGIPYPALLGLHAKRGGEGVSLGLRQAIKSIEQRPAEQVERRESQLHLGLDRRHAGNSAARCLLKQIIEQRRLAHAGLAA